MKVGLGRRRIDCIPSIENRSTLGDRRARGPLRLSPIFYAYTILYSRSILRPSNAPAAVSEHLQLDSRFNVSFLCTTGSDLPRNETQTPLFPSLQQSSLSHHIQLSREDPRHAHWRRLNRSKNLISPTHASHELITRRMPCRCHYSLQLSYPHSSPKGKDQQAGLDNPMAHDAVQYFIDSLSDGKALQHANRAIKSQHRCVEQGRKKQGEVGGTPYAPIDAALIQTRPSAAERLPIQTSAVHRDMNK